MPKKRTMKPVKTALISVYHKEGLGPIVKKLNELGVDIISTGGTEKFINNLGIPVKKVEDLTSYPSILGGRVKTLHPKVFGGILARRELNEDIAQLEEYQIPQIDLVIVDLYPFEETVYSGADEQSIIEKIDIGGISLIRAAAKNFKDTLIVSSMEAYSDLLVLLESQNGATTLDQRKGFASKAFNISSHYDTKIHEWFTNNTELTSFKYSELSGNELRYGENPHQKGYFFGDLNKDIEQLHGKAISYNNLVDIDAAVQLVSEFDECTFAVLKHNNACGLASRPSLNEAWKGALAGDPVSAFGGVLVCNRNIDKETAEEMHKIFFEVLIAPSYDADALDILKQKKNRILLVNKIQKLPSSQFRSLLNGVLLQDCDRKVENKEELVIAGKHKPSKEEVEDLLFANKLAKHTKSNTIVLAKNKQLLGSGMGQTSRVDALRQAITKAKAFSFDLAGAVMASDAFFPFSDCVEIASEAGIRAVIQPGGSIRDKDSVEYCDTNGMSMSMTGVRHFKH